MAKPLVSDELWAVVEPLLPPTGPPGTRGRPRVPDRVALTGIVFVLKTGIPWAALPATERWPAGVTCWRRLRRWHRAGVWRRLLANLLSEDHSEADGRGQHRVELEGYGYRWFRIGGLDYILQRSK